MILTEHGCAPTDFDLRLDQGLFVALLLDTLLDSPVPKRRIRIRDGFVNNLRENVFVCTWNPDLIVRVGRNLRRFAAQVSLLVSRRR